MTTPDLPPVHSSGDAFLPVIARQQAATNELLAQILDRFPARPVPDPDVVELREPAPVVDLPAGPGNPEPIKVAEPVESRPTPRRRRTTSKKGA